MVEEHCSYVSEMSLNFNPPQSHSIELFDPDMGDLVRVEVNLSVNWSESIMYHNLDAYPKDVNISSELGQSVTMPDGSALATNFTDLVIENVSAYNNTDPLTCAPPDGFDYRRSEQTWYSSSYTEEEDLRAFTSAEDGETISFPISTLCRFICDDHENRALMFFASADSSMCVRYTYDVPQNGGTEAGGAI